MQTIKNGSKGEDVKKLQTILGITADGVFGKNTEAKVKEFQKSHGLTADGVVGPKTWDMLLKYEKKECITIAKAPLTKHITKKKRDIKYLVIHYTATSSSKDGSAIKVRNGWQNGSASASADFVVDDKNIIQANPDLKNYYCWAVGDGNGKYGITNTNSISIEMCSTLEKGTSAAVPNHKGWSLSEEVLDNAEKLAKLLMKEYNIPFERVVRHYDASRKDCPGIVGWNDDCLYDEKSGKRTTSKNNSKKWLEWKERLKK